MSVICLKFHSSQPRPGARYCKSKNPSKGATVSGIWMIDDFVGTMTRTTYFLTKTGERYILKSTYNLYQGENLTLASFHNHITHHILSIFALGATPSEIQRAFDENKGRQRPHFPIEDQIVHDMANPAGFTKYLGEEKCDSPNRSKYLPGALSCSYLVQILPRLRRLL